MTQGCQCHSAGLGGHHPSLLLTASCLWCPGHNGLASSRLLPSGLGEKKGSPGLCSFLGMCWEWDPCCEYIPAGVKVVTQEGPLVPSGPQRAQLQLARQYSSPGVFLHRREQPWPGPFSQENTGQKDSLQGLLPLPCLGAYGEIGIGEKAASAFEGAARQYLLGEELRVAGSSAC